MTEITEMTAKDKLEQREIKKSNLEVECKGSVHDLGGNSIPDIESLNDDLHFHWAVNDREVKQYEANGYRKATEGKDVKVFGESLKTSKTTGTVGGGITFDAGAGDTITLMCCTKIKFENDLRKLAEKNKSRIADTYQQARQDMGSPYVMGDTGGVSVTAYDNKNVGRSILDIDRDGQVINKL